MTPRKILALVAAYRLRFEREGIPKRRMDVDSHFSCPDEMPMHAHYLLDGIEENANNPDRWGEVNHQLGIVQTLLWVFGWYTLEDLMSHNRPD